MRWPWKRKKQRSEVAKAWDRPIKAPAALEMMLAHLREQYVHVEIVNDTLVICPTWQDWRVLMRQRYLMEDDTYVPANQTKPFTGRHS